jgi:hypothetical protein
MYQNPMQLQAALAAAQAQLGQLNSLFSGINGQQAQQLPTSQPQPQASAPDLSVQQLMLLKMYDEFANTDDGKALAAGLTKFSRFVHSKVKKE